MRSVQSGYAACDAEHCPMYLASEYLKERKDVAFMVIGTRECAYYTFKYLTAAERKRICAFELTDREMVLGDLTDLSAAVDKFAAPGKKTLLIVTCVPSLISLEIFNLCRDGVYAVELPDFKPFTDDDVRLAVRRALGEE